MEGSRMGPRAKSAGDELGRVASMAHEIEYELAQVGEEDVQEGGEGAGGGRVVMMYDEEGNATPVQMGQFYYDSVQAEDLADTARANVPRPLDSYEIVEDAEDEEYEDDDDEGDPYQNQFMRISIPAQQLKDVSRVKKDLDHDKPQRRGSLMAGLQRAVSSVRIGDGRVAARQPSENRASLAQVGRMMSMNRDKGEERGLQRERSVPAAKPKRQNLATVGRMMSMNRKKATEGISTGEGGSEASQGSQPMQGKRSGLAQVGRLMSINRKKAIQPDAGSDAHKNETVSKEGKVADGGQAMETESVVSERSVDRERSIDRERRDSRPDKSAGGQVRMSLNKMGRLMSLSRKKQPTSQSAPQQAATSEQQGEGGHGQKLQMSPLSTSTVSTKAAESTSEQDRQSTDGDRQRPSTASSSNVRKEATRMSLKAAGRLLSFSRKPAVDNSNRGRTLLAPDGGQSSDFKGKAKRTQSVPPKTNCAESGSSVPGESAQKLDGRASKFFYTEINSDRVRMSGILGSDTHIRIPAIAMAEYSGPVSRTKWYIDGFTLPHNAVRRECLDLYEILAAMARFRGNGDITRDDINDFEDWWKVATEFITCYFEMERTVLFPWVDSAGTKDWEVQMALKKMRSMKDKLQEYLTRIDNVWNEKIFKDPGEMFALVYKAVDDFVPRLMNYFADQEVLLPAIVKGYYTLEDRLKMDRDMISAFMGGALTRKNKEEPHHNLILLIRWIGNSRQLRAWVGKNLSSVAKGMYGTWYDMYQEQHYRFVRTLKNRSKAMLVETS